MKNQRLRPLLTNLVVPRTFQSDVSIIGDRRILSFCQDGRCEAQVREYFVS